MIQVSDSAVKAIRQLVVGQDAPDAGLRIFVQKGGCSGLQYAMTIARPEPTDLKVDAGEACVYLDEESQKYLKGSVIDYSSGLSNTGFKIENPNARQTCGCGTSFEA